MSLGASAAGPFLGRFHQNPIFFGGLFPSAHSAAPEIGLTPVTRCSAPPVAAFPNLAARPSNMQAGAQFMPKMPTSHQGVAWLVFSICKQQHTLTERCSRAGRLTAQAGAQSGAPRRVYYVVFALFMRLRHLN